MLKTDKINSRQDINSQNIGSRQGLLQIAKLSATFWESILMSIVWIVLIVFCLDNFLYSDLIYRLNRLDR